MIVKPMVLGDCLEKSQLTHWPKQNLGILTFYKVRLFKGSAYMSLSPQVATFHDLSWSIRWRIGSSFSQMLIFVHFCYILIFN